MHMQITIYSQFGCSGRYRRWKQLFFVLSVNLFNHENKHIALCYAITEHYFSIDRSTLQGTATASHCNIANAKTTR